MSSTEADGEPVAWRHPTPHGWVVTKTKHMDSQPLYAAPVSESAAIPKVVAAFIAPDNQQWQGMSVMVTEDGRWWTFNGTKWEQDAPALTANSPIGNEEGK